MNGFNTLLGIEIVGPSADGFVITLDIDSNKHHHDAGLVHGGVYLSLLDTVMSRAVRDAFSGNVYAPTLSINVNFFRPAESGVIKAVGKIINQSRSTCCIEGRVYDDAGKLLAQGTGTMFLKDIGGKAP